MNIKNILILTKKSKLNYLIEKHGISYIETSDEFHRLKDSMAKQIHNTDYFLEIFKSTLKPHQAYDLVTDSFLENEEIKKMVNRKDYDLVITLGGDGTFLRCVSLLQKKNPFIVGVNTDTERSLGYYCSLNLSKDLDQILKRLLNNDIQRKYYNRIEVNFAKSNQTYYFVNDLYYGEKFPGRISKYGLYTEENSTRQNFIFKSSGLIVSTGQGYSGWIQNAKSMPYSLFETLFPGVPRRELLERYQSKFRINLEGKENESRKIFYLVREPNIKSSFEIDQDWYYKKLRACDGSCDLLKIKNYCFDGNIIIDGSFQISTQYDEEILISVGDNKIHTINI